MHLHSIPGTLDSRSTVSQGVLVPDRFIQKHSILIHCPQCGGILRITEWTTSLVCSCGRRMDALDILFESFTQSHLTGERQAPCSMASATR